jgi:hypothetical protein
VDLERGPGEGRVGIFIMFMITSASVTTNEYFKYHPSSDFS